MTDRVIIAGAAELVPDEGRIIAPSGISFPAQTPKGVCPECRGPMTEMLSGDEVCKKCGHERKAP